MNEKKVIIFDFDGTLADTGPIIQKIYGELASKNNWTALTPEMYLELRKGNLRQARKWSGMHFWQFPLVLHSVRRLMRLESEKVQLFPGIAELILELHTRGYELYVLSRNSQETITHVLKRYNLQDQLQVLSRRRRTLGSKTAVIRSLLRQKGYSRSNVWMIGDEVRDILAGKNAEVLTVAVSWGFQDESILSRANPTRLVHTVDELRAVLQS